MTYVKRAQRYAWGRRYLTVALLALIIGTVFAVTAALGSGSKGSGSASSANSLLAAGGGSTKATNCGYPVAGAPVPANFGVVEPTTLPGFRPSVTSNGAAVTPSNPATISAAQTLQAFYTDEHAMTLGTKNVEGASKTIPEMSNGTAGSTATFAHVTSPGDGANIANGGDEAPQNGNTGVDGRPLAPELYITDITVGAPGALSSTSTETQNATPTATYQPAGDWQKVLTDGATADEVFGQWKNATVTGDVPSDSTTNPATISIAQWNGTASSGNAPALGQDSYPTTLTGLGHLAELRWNPVAGSNGTFSVGGKTLLPGHTYRLEFELHDGDHALDSGEACTYVKAPALPTSPITTASASSTVAGVATATLAGDPTRNNVLDASVSDTLSLSGGTANAGDASSDCSVNPTTKPGCLIFRLYKQGTGTGGTTAQQEARCRGGTNPGTPVNDVDGNAVVISMAADNGANASPATDTTPGDPGVYGVDATLAHVGTYHWTVQYTGNSENLGFGETACNIPLERVDVAPGSTVTDTTPKVKIDENINISINVSGGLTGNATGSIKAGDNVTIKLFKGTCTTANHNTGGTQQGNTINLVLQTTDSTQNGFIDSNGVVHINQLQYPDDFGAGAPDLVTSDYWWNVIYSPSSSNTDVTGSDDGCTEAFHITL